MCWPDTYYRPALDWIEHELSSPDVSMTFSDPAQTRRRYLRSAKPWIRIDELIDRATTS